MGEFAAAASRASTCLPELAQGALQQRSPRVPVLGGRGVASRAVAQPRQRCKQLLLPQAFPFALCLRRHQRRDERRRQHRTALGHGAADAVDGSRVDGCLNHRAEALPAYSVLTAGRHARDARHARDLIHADRARVHLECKGTLLLLEGVFNWRIATSASFGDSHSATTRTSSRLPPLLPLPPPQPSIFSAAGALLTPCGRSVRHGAPPSRSLPS
mmetsp:Transcript_7965/g.23462  ORF Transcript_7965/g.23462 Transcript_7965/m.23462 type:complete len:215 (-) Transcript_7965:655-1299(-)